jgi:hypothetical protein
VPLTLHPLTYAEACRFIKAHHRHHLPPQGWKFGVAAGDGLRTVGVVVVGRPVSRRLDDGLTLEVTRCCTDGTRNCASLLYGAAWRAAKALGYRRLLTYTLAAEPGTSLVAAGWRRVGPAGGGSWHRRKRPRATQAPTGKKTLWEQAVPAGEGTHARAKVQERRTRAHRRLVATREVSFTCLGCGRAVSQHRFPGPAPRYCGQACRSAARRAYQRELMRKRRARRGPE